MKKTDNVPWEVLGVLFLIITTIAITSCTGWLALKLYRKFRPIEQAPLDRLDIIKVEEKDSFFSLFFTGTVICIPFYYLIYAYLTHDY